MNSRRIWLLVFVLFSINPVLAQRSVFFYTDLKIFPQVEVVQKNKPVTLGEIIRKDKLTYLRPAYLPKVRKDVDYWLRFDLSPHLDLFEMKDTIYLDAILFEWAHLYKLSGKGDTSSVQISFFEDKEFKSKSMDRSFIPFTRQELLDGKYIVIKTQAILDQTLLKEGRYLVNTERDEIVHNQAFFRWFFQRDIRVYFFIGLAGALFFLNLAFFAWSRERLYLFYGLFLVLQTSYYAVFQLNFLWEYHYPKAYFIFINVVQVAINLSYLLFTRSFLDMPVHYPVLNKIVICIAGFLLLLIIADVIILSFDPFFYYQSLLMHIQRYFMALFTIYGVGHLLFFKKSNLAYFIVAGTLAFVSGALFTLFFVHVQYMMIGAGVESLVFASGLAYRMKIVFDEKLRFEHEVNQLGKIALRAQMNPHFIFNSLNSIQHLITTGDKAAALKYLSKFSHLLRQILENSMEVNVTIKREVDLLKLYLELESLRFDKSFQYSICLDERLDIHNEEVPLFLIQPYIENAIVHGLVHKDEGDRMLAVEFSDDNEFITCKVTDNGIGRKAAEALKRNYGHTSRGTSVAQERLEIINRNKTRKTLVSFEDLVQGTRVTINIPKM